MRSLPRRLLARFALLAFALYHVPLFLNDYPTFGGGGFREDGIAHSWGHIFGQVGLWVARQVFGKTGPMPEALEGDNGDTTQELCRFLVGVVLATVVAVVWTIADRKRPCARWVEGALHIVLRYAIILGLASYGMAKLYPVQFGPIPLVAFELRVGELSPAGLLWRFMEYSLVYSTFAGILEMAVVVLLTFRRTTTLGALLCIPVLTNVALVNLCYGVPVKLFSTMMVVSAAVLVLYDVRPLINVLVLRRPALPSPPTPPFRSHRLNQLRWLVKLVVVGGVIASSAVAMSEIRDRTAADEASPLYGTWDVHSLVKDGRELVQTAEPGRWRRVILTSRFAMIRLQDESLVNCQCQQDSASQTLTLTCQKSHQEATLHWSRRAGALELDGTIDRATVRAALTIRETSEMPLLRAQFRWTMD